MAPNETNEVARKISNMEIRGASNISRSAVKAIKAEIEESNAKNTDELMENIQSAGKKLIQARPSAISLKSSVRSILARIEKRQDFRNIQELKDYSVSIIEDFVEKTKEATERIGIHGAEKIENGDMIMTHCNSSNFISILKTAVSQGKNFQVIVTETRPRFQGHKTVKELEEIGIPTSLIVDSSSGFFMKNTDRLLVGASGIGSQGTVLSKIGTLPMAITAQEFDVPVTIAIESFKFYPEPLQTSYNIKERKPEELTDPEKFPETKIRNPAFDFTPPKYIDLIITEHGSHIPENALNKIFPKKIISDNPKF